MNNIEIERLVMQRIMAWQYFDKLKTARVNQNFVPPAAGVWIRVTILGGINAITSIFIDPCVRESGQVVIQLFDRENAGTGNLKLQADSLAKHLNCYTAGKLNLLAASTVDCGTTNTVDLGADSKGFYQYNVIVPYEYN